MYVSSLIVQSEVDCASFGLSGSVLTILAADPHRRQIREGPPAYHAPDLGVRGEAGP